MRQRTDAHEDHISGGGAFGTSDRLRQANAERLQTLLSRTAAPAGAAKTRAGAALTGDYLDFENAEFGGRWMNVGWAVLVALALILFYVMWFTDWVR
ncbi:hypothetical protein NESM_000680700 [Novymonas esmeraldas]|uniref:Uncharacterized protein n=1 Tax=Novymonas esmeraldas TaxID=1808958 RepID=A0AAW0ESX7_9TRYP